MSSSTCSSAFVLLRWKATTTLMRPRERCALISSRMRGSNSISSFGRLMEISLCLRLMELSSTVNLNPSFAASPRPYPVIDLMPSSFQSIIPEQCENRGPHHKRVHRQPHHQCQNIAFGRGRPLPHLDPKYHADKYPESDQHLMRCWIEPPDLAASWANPFPSPQIMPESVDERNQTLVAVAASKIRPHSFNRCAI